MQQQQQQNGLNAWQYAPAMEFFQHQNAFYSHFFSIFLSIILFCPYLLNDCVGFDYMK